MKPMERIEAAREARLWIKQIVARQSFCLMQTIGKNLELD